MATATEGVSGDWLYEDEFLHEVEGADVRRISATNLPIDVRRASRASRASSAYGGGSQQVVTSARLGLPGSRQQRSYKPELLDADFLRQLLPPKSRTELLSRTHRGRNKRQRVATAGAAQKRRTGTPAAGAGSGTPSWLSSTLPRGKTAPAHVLREQWRAMEAARNKPEVDDVLDEQTRAEMAEEKEELAAGMGLSMTELEEMDAAVNDAEGEDDEAMYMQAFADFDADGSGDISPEELRQVIHNLGVPLPEDEITKMIEEADEDGDGSIDYEEFVRMMKAKKTLLAMAKVLSQSRTATRQRRNSTAAGSTAGFDQTQDTSMSSSMRSSAGLPPLKLESRSLGRKHHRQHGKHGTRPLPSVLRSGVTPTLGKLRSELTTSKDMVRVLNQKVKDDVAWVQANCPVTNIRAQIFCQKWGLEKMQNVMQRIHHSFLIAAFDKWLEYTDYKANQERAEAYLKYKGSRTLINMFVNWKKKKCQTAWNSWTNFVQYVRAEQRHKAAVQTQRLARGFLGRNKVRHIRQLRAVIQMQRLVRGHVTRIRVERHREWLIRDKAARYIQNRYRGYAGRKLLLVLLNAKRKFEAAREIQRIMRGALARVRFIELEKQHQLNMAAREIQRVGRGYLGRKRVRTIRARMARIRGAICMQKVFRGMLGRRRAAIAKRRHLAALRIQCWVRGEWGRRTALQRKKLVKSILIQSIWRMALAKMRCTFIRQTIAAKRIQNCFRGRIARRTYYRMLEAKRVHDERQRTSAINIQRIGRGYITRRYMEERQQRERENDAAINIQRVIRGFLGRCRYHRIKDAHDRHMVETAAALKIQTLFRGYCGRKIFKIKRAERDAENAVEAAKEAKLRAEEEARLGRLSAEARAEEERQMAERNAAAIKVQTMVRGRQARDKVHHMRITQAATKIQTPMRGVLARRRVARLRKANAEAAERAKNQKIWEEQTAAAIKIQCAFRSRKARQVVGIRRKEVAEAAAKAEADRIEAARVAAEAEKLREQMGDDAGNMDEKEMQDLVRAKEIRQKENDAAKVLQAAGLGLLARRSVKSIRHQIRHARGKKLEQMRLAALQRARDRRIQQEKQRAAHRETVAAREKMVQLTLANASALNHVDRIREAEEKNVELFGRWEQEEAIIRIQCLMRRKLARKRIEWRKKEQEAELRAAEEARLKEEEMERMRRRQQEELAATKIQALARAREAKKEADQRRAVVAEQRRKEEEARAALERELAASKIAALYRGKRARAEVSVIREEWLEKQRIEEEERLAWEEAERVRLEEEAAAAAEAAANALPEGWEEYWDETMQAYYYFNPATQEARWTKPGAEEGYGTAGTVGDYETDNQNANTPICVECEYEYATKVCDQCEDNFCDACYDAAHATGRKQKHTWQPVAQTVGGVEVPYCIECEEVYATKRCDQCGDPYCDPCFESTHARGRKREHTFSSVVQMCVECESNAATRACAQCMDPYCDECYDYTHRKGKKKLHTWTAVQATKEEAQEWLEYYDETYQRPYYYNPYTQETVWVDPRKA